MPNEETTTKFKVDISELKKSMQEAKRATQLANSEFKLAASECDNWQQSSNALSAKIKALNSTLNEQKSKLALLEAEYDGLTDAQKQGSAEATRLLTSINKQKAAINSTEKEINGYENSLEQVTKAENVAAVTGKDVSEVLDDMGDKAKSAEGGFTVLKGALSNLVASGIKAAISGLKDLGQAFIDAYQTCDEGADTVIAKTGAIGESAQELIANYKNVSKSIVGDFSDIGTAVGEVSTRFGVTGTDLENLSTKFLKFAELNGTDLNGSIDTVQKSLSAFGLETSEAGSVLDTFNKVGQDTGISMDTLSTLLVDNASSFSQMGLDIHQAASFLGEVEKSGVTTSVAMTSLSKASQYAAEANKPFTTVLEETTKKMKNAKTDSEGLQVAYDVFGKKAGAKIYEACKQGSLSFEELSKAMQDNSGSIDATYEATQDGMDKIKLAIQGVKTDVGDAIASFLDEHKDGIVDFIENIKNGFQWVMDNGSTIISVIAGIGAGFVAFQVASLIMGVVEAFKAFKAANEGASTAQALFNAIMGANPMVKIVSIILAVITAIVTFIATNDEARAKFTEIWQSVKDFFVGVWDGIVSFFTETIPNAFKSVIDWVKENFDLLLTFLINPFAGLFKYFYENNTKFKEFVDNAVNFIKELPSKIWTWLSDVISKVKNWVTDMVDKAKQAGSDFVDKVVGFIKDLPSKIGETLSNVINKIVEWATNLASEGAKAATDLFNAVKDGVKELPEKLKSIGKDVVEGFKNGIKNAWDNLTEWFKGLFGDLKDIAKKILGIKSPSREFRYIGQMVAEGLQIGIEKNSEKVIEALDKLLEDLKLQKELSLITEGEYYSQLAKLRDEYLKVGSKEWWDYTKEIISYQDGLYDNVVETHKSAIEELKEAEQDFKDILSEERQMFGEVTFTTAMGNEATKLSLTDWTKDIAKLTEYNNLLENVGLRLKGVFGEDNASYEELMELIRAGGLDEGANLAGLLLNANDEELRKYINGWREVNVLTDKVAYGQFGDKLTQAQTDFVDELAELQKSLPEGFEDTGLNAVINFVKGFVSGLPNLASEIKYALNDVVLSALGTDDLSAVVDVAAGIGNALTTRATVYGTGTGGVVNNYTQVINSPKSLNRLDIYRNTNNLLNYKGGK